jgi:hypothetical protein
MGLQLQQAVGCQQTTWGCGLGGAWRPPSFRGTGAHSPRPPPLLAAGGALGLSPPRACRAGRPAAQLAALWA